MEVAGGVTEDVGKRQPITKGSYGTEITHSEYTVSICMWKRFMYFVDSC